MGIFAIEALLCNNCKLLGKAQKKNCVREFVENCMLIAWVGICAKLSSQSVSHSSLSVMCD